MAFHIHAWPGQMDRTASDLPVLRGYALEVRDMSTPMIDLQNSPVDPLLLTSAGVSVLHH